MTTINGSFRLGDHTLAVHLNGIAIASLGSEEHLADEKHWKSERRLYRQGTPSDVCLGRLKREPGACLQRASLGAAVARLRGLSANQSLIVWRHTALEALASG